MDKINHLYGHFTPQQIDVQFKILHNMIFWLLLYKDPETEYKYRHINFEKYFNSLMKRISGFGELLYNPPEVCTLLSILQGAYIETQEDEFDYEVYRKLILDSHNSLDKLKECI